MRASSRRSVESDTGPVRVLGRGLRAQRGVRLPLRVLREAVGKTQVDVASESQIDQADVSRLERRTDLGDCQVSTLERYIATIGGQLELVATFGNKKIILAPVESAPAATALRAKTSRRRRTPRTGRR